MFIYQVYKNTDRDTRLVGTYRKYEDAKDYILGELKCDEEFAENEGTECKTIICPGDVYISSYTLGKLYQGEWKTNVWRIVKEAII